MWEFKEENIETTVCSSLSSSALKYGSLPDMAANNDAGTSKVTYCVHGKPGGCCATIVTDGRKAPNPITIGKFYFKSRIKFDLYFILFIYFFQKSKFKRKVWFRNIAVL